MFKDISKFQIVLIGFFALFIVVGMAVFSLYRGGSGGVVPTITVWGTLDARKVTPFFEQAANRSGNKIQLKYVQKTAREFDLSFLEALSLGKGPDMVLVSQDTILKQSNKLSPIGYKTYPEVNFKNTFVEGAELFLSPQGVSAIPFLLDPLVMYWNRDIFTNANVSLPPRRWDEFLTLTPQLAKRDAARNVTQAAVALGEYRNVTHARDILSLLIMQAGNPIVTRTNLGFESTLDSSLGFAVQPANSALTFYTQFADPLKSTYTWNRGLPDSKTMFLSNKLAIYFGYASEYEELRSKNPNLNFDVASVPQPRVLQGRGVATTYGTLYGFAIVASSPRRQAAYDALTLITSRDNFAVWSQITGLPSVRRDALAADPSNAASSVFSSSVLQARSWWDPDRAATEALFRDMIEGVTSGRQLYSEAIDEAHGKLQQLIDPLNQANEES